MNELQRRIELGAELAEVRSAARALIDSLPKCDKCMKPATRAFQRGAARLCDEHGVDVVLVQAWGRQTLPEYPRAAPLRVLIKLLEI